jgi:hypothetical protein
MIRFGKLEVRVKTMEDEEKLAKGDQTKVQKVHKEVEDLKKSFAQIMAEQEEEKKREEAKGSKVMDREMQGKMLEMMEREKRRNNLIFMGIKEGDDEKASVEGIVELLVTEARVNFEIVGRVGRRGVAGDDQEEVKPRPLRICIEDVSDRRRLLSRAKNLKGSDHKMIYVAPDLTRMQQEEDRKLREKLREIRLSGKKYAKISKGEIVEVDGGQKVVLYSQQY